MTESSHIDSVPPQSHRQRFLSLPDTTIIRQRSSLGNNMQVGRGVLPDNHLWRHYREALRKMVYGSTIHAYSNDFKRNAFMFQSADGPFAFGLVGDRNGARTVIMCVQAVLLRHLIFQYLSREEIRYKNVLKPKEKDRLEKLIQSMADILWQAGGKHRACVCLIQKEDCFVPPDRKYHKDGLTEKLRLFYFNSYEAVKDFLKKNMKYFDDVTKSGVLLFIYSVVFSRTLEGVQEDWGGGEVQLLTDNEECSQALINLLLTGHALQYVHNGNIHYDDHDQMLVFPQKGIQERSDVGFLFYHNEESDKHRTQVGSMLKTPRYPVWMTLVNGHPGVLFSLNPDLVSDWRSEHKFTLHYYTALLSQKHDALLNVDTRLGRQLQSQTKQGQREEQKRIPVLEKCIMTKWPGCHIEWENGIIPFVT